MAGRIIDGNQIINDNLADKAQYGGRGYGLATDSATGKVLAEVNGQPGQRSAFIQPERPTLEQAGLVPAQQARDQEIADAIYEVEEYQGGGDYGPDYVEGGSPDDSYVSQEDYNPQDDPEFMAAQEQYLYDAGVFSNYMEETGQTIDDVWNGMGDQMSRADMDLFMDPRKADTPEKQMRLGELNDLYLDFTGSDPKEFYENNKMVPCQGDCLDRQRKMRDYAAGQADQQEQRVLAEDDTGFSERYIEPS